MKPGLGNNGQRIAVGIADIVERFVNVLVSDFAGISEPLFPVGEFFRLRVAKGDRIDERMRSKEVREASSKGTKSNKTNLNAHGYSPSF